jgi:hypothetical protein
MPARRDHPHAVLDALTGVEHMLKTADVDEHAGMVSCDQRTPSRDRC